MPTVTDTQRELLRSCTDALCPGYEQVAVRGIEREVSFSFKDLRGASADPHDLAFDMAGAIERSMTQFLPLDDRDRECPTCGKPTVIDAQVRPVYDNASGRDPLEVARRGLDRGARIEHDSLTRALLERQAVALEHQAESNDFRVALAEQATRMEQMAGLIERQASVIDELQARRRPRKAEESTS